MRIVDDLKFVFESHNEMQQQQPQKRRKTKDELKVVELSSYVNKGVYVVSQKVIDNAHEYAPKQAIMMLKCFIFRIWSFKIDINFMVDQQIDHACNPYRSKVIKVYAIS